MKWTTHLCTFWQKQTNTVLVDLLDSKPQGAVLVHIGSFSIQTLFSSRRRKLTTAYVHANVHRPKFKLILFLSHKCLRNETELNLSCMTEWCRWYKLIKYFGSWWHYWFEKIRYSLVEFQLIVNNKCLIMDRPITFLLLSMIDKRCNIMLVTDQLAHHSCSNSLCQSVKLLKSLIESPSQPSYLSSLFRQTTMDSDTGTPSFGKLFAPLVQWTFSLWHLHGNHDKMSVQRGSKEVTLLQSLFSYHFPWDQKVRKWKIILIDRKGLFGTKSRLFIVEHLF